MECFGAQTFSSHINSSNFKLTTFLAFYFSSCFFKLVWVNQVFNLVLLYFLFSFSSLFLRFALRLDSASFFYIRRLSS